MATLLPSRHTASEVSLQKLPEKRTLREHFGNTRTHITPSEGLGRGFRTVPPEPLWLQSIELLCSGGVGWTMLSDENATKLVDALVRMANPRQTWMDKAAKYASVWVTVFAALSTIFIGISQRRLVELQVLQVTSSVAAVDLQCEYTSGSTDSNDLLTVRMHFDNPGNLPVQVVHRRLEVWLGMPAKLGADTVAVSLNEPQEAGAIYWKERVFDGDLGAAQIYPKASLPLAKSWQVKPEGLTVAHVAVTLTMSDGSECRYTKHVFRNAK